MLLKRRDILEKLNQTGSMMIEALAMLTLIAMVTPTLYKKSAERTTELQDINTASQMRTMIKAVDNYTASNYEAILEELKKEGADGIGAMSTDKLSEYLPYGYKFEAVKNFDAPKVVMQLDEGGNSITSFLVLPGAIPIGDMRASRIASMVGSNGGFIDNEGAAKGVGGVWGLDADSVGKIAQKIDANIPKDSIVVASAEAINAASANAFENDNYLERTKNEGNEWRNMMEADFYMGGIPDRFGNEEDMHSILGVDQMIIGGTTKDEQSALTVLKTDSNDGSAFIQGNLKALNSGFAVTNEETTGNTLAFDNIIKANSSEISMLGGSAGTPPAFELIKGTGEEKGQANLNVNTVIDGTLKTTDKTQLVTNGGEFEVGDGGSLITGNDKNDGKQLYLLTKGGDFQVGNNGDILKADAASFNALNGQVVATVGEKINTVGLLDGKIQAKSEKTGDAGSEVVVSDLTVDMDTINLQGMTKVGTGASTAESVFGTDAVPAAFNEQLKLDVQGNAYIGGDLATNKFYTNEFDTRTLRAGSETLGAEAQHWLNVDKDGIKVTDKNKKDRMVINETNGTQIYGPRRQSDGVASGIEMGSTDMEIYSIKNTNISTLDPNSLVKLQNSVVEVKGNGNLSGNPTAVTMNTDTLDIYNPYADDKKHILTVDTVEDPLKENALTGGQRNASVYIRRGAIEVEGSPSYIDNNQNEADQGMGYIEASRLVANNTVAENGTYIRPVYAERFGESQQIDRYMVNPAYTSVMHDIKLTTRGGARLSDILPDFINKGIYIVNNTYKDTINFNDITVKEVNGILKPYYGGAGVQEINIAGSLSGTDQWASPFMGVVPAPVCPPGHARVITITPASFQMAQTGGVVYNHSLGRYYVNENAKANELADINTSTLPNNSLGEGEVTGSELQQKVVLSTTDPTMPETQTIYYLGLGRDTDVKNKSGISYSPKPLYFQQSTWLKSKVIAQSLNHSGKCDPNYDPSCAENFAGWSAVMGFIYPESLYRDIINALAGVTISETEKDNTTSSDVYWNIFPVRTQSMEAYATVYCYFDRTNIFGSSNDPKYVDQYDQVNAFRKAKQKLGSAIDNATGASPYQNNDYIERLNDPQLKYNDPW